MKDYAFTFFWIFATSAVNALSLAIKLLINTVRALSSEVPPLPVIETVAVSVVAPSVPNPTMPAGSSQDLNYCKRSGAMTTLAVLELLMFISAGFVQS